MSYVKKNSISILLILLGILTVAFIFQRERIQNHRGQAQAASEDGLWCIATSEDLVELSDLVNQGKDFVGIHVVLTADLDMKEVQDFRPIGIYDGDQYFCGVFDGQGHTISNLSIDCAEGSSNNGLFGTLGGTVCNLVLENTQVRGSACGAVCSIALGDKSKIYNCLIKNPKIEAGYTDYVGGQYLGKKENCVIALDGIYSVLGNSWEEETFDLQKWAEKLNDELIEISARSHGIKMCNWTIQGDDLLLSKDDKSGQSDLSLRIANYSLNTKLEPIYQDGVYYFMVPYETCMDGMTLEWTGEDANKKTLAISKERVPIVDYEQSFTLRDEGEIVQDEDAKLQGEDTVPREDDALLQKEDARLQCEDTKLQCEDAELQGKASKLQVKLCYTKDVGSVFVDTRTKWGMDYLEGSKLNFLSGILQVVNEEGKADYKGGLEYIKGRGNDSWLSSKKGFGIKLLKDADLLGLGRDKEYALVPGYRDESLLTYMVTADLCREMQLEYAPNYKFVQFYVDGAYQGLYVLAEKINVGPNRINLDTSWKDETGGYLYEIDDLDYIWEDDYFSTPHGNIIVISEPAYPTRKQVEYSQFIWNMFESAIYEPSGTNEFGVYYGDLMDIDSLAKIWLFYELNGEYSVSSSVNFYKDSNRRGDGKIHALYPWDMEHACVKWELVETDSMNTLNAGGTNGFWPAVWQHKEIREAVYKNWRETFRPAVLKLMDPENVGKDSEVSYIGSYGKKYEVASKWNELVWGEEHNLAKKGNSIEKWMKVRVPFLDQFLEEEAGTAEE